MAEIAKYPAQQLTEDDEEILYKVVIKHAVTFYNLIQADPNPKGLAKKIVSKAEHSDKYIAALHTVAYIENSPTDQILEPGEINEKLANQIKNSIQQDIISEVECNKNNGARFLHPRDLSGVLKKFEKHGILLHIEGKERIKDLLHKKHYGKKSLLSVLTQHSRGGKLSVYLVREDVDKLKRAMEKPKALDYLYNLVIKSGLAHKIMKYLMLATLHGIKMNEDTSRKFMGVGASLFQQKMNEQHINELNQKRQILQSINDKQLEQYIELNIDELTKSFIYDGGYSILLFLAALPKL